MSYETPNEPFKNIYRRKDKRGRDLEEFHLSGFDEINNGDEVTYSIVNPDGTRGPLKKGIVSGKLKSQLQFDVKELFPSGEPSREETQVYIEEIHSYFPAEKK